MREIEKKNSASELIAMEQRDAEYEKIAMWHDIKKGHRSRTRSKHACERRRRKITIRVEGRKWLSEMQ
jgi:hypothetical protein